MTERDNSLVLEQTLHGYQDGHSLVYSSFKLSPSSRRTMLVLSDMSGPSMTKGFDSYLTCYPLEAEGYYVFARTWNAPEMERPGCVWTHSLLVRFADISKITNPRVLELLFVRPQTRQISNSKHDFLKPIDFAFQVGNFEPIHQHHESMQILDGLYGGRDLPVVFPISTASQMDSLALDIWAQQWPRLRRSFKFCTGAISFRQLDGVPFDLQFVPQKRYSKIVREFGVERRVEWDEPIYGEDIKWLRVAVADLYSPSGGRLRDFFREFAIDTKLTRGAFRPLVEVFVELQEETPSISKIRKKFLRCFPGENEGLRLKNALHGTTFDESGSWFFRQIPEAEKLKLLLASPAPLAESVSAEHVYQRACSLWHSDPLGAEAVLEDLLSTETNDYGKPFLSGLLNSMPPQRVSNFTLERPGLLALFVEHEPRLATSSELWNSECVKHKEIVAGLERVWTKLDDKDRERVVRTLMARRNGTLLDQFLHFAHVSDLKTILECLVGSKDGPDGETKRTLSKYSSHFMRMFEVDDLNMELFTRAFEYFDQDNHDVSTFARRMSALVAAEEGIFPENKERADFNYFSAGAGGEFATFVFVDGMSGGRKDAARKIAMSFETVHGLLAHGHLSIAWQKKVESVTPRLSLFESWDTCERVRRGTVGFFAKNGFDRHLFFRLTSDLKLFSQLVTSGLKSKKGRKFLGQLKKDINVEAFESESLFQKFQILCDALK